MVVTCKRKIKKSIWYFIWYLYLFYLVFDDFKSQMYLGT